MKIPSAIYIIAKIRSAVSIFKYWVENNTSLKKKESNKNPFLHLYEIFHNKILQKLITHFYEINKLYKFLKSISKKY